MATQSPADKIRDAKLSLVKRDPFFARMALEPEYLPAPWLPTMATDGVTILYNESFVDQTPLAELIGIVAHEGAHIGFGHCARRGGRDATLWNYACDYIVNPMVRDAGFALPAGALFDSRFGPHMTAEQVYKVLEQERAKASQGQNGQQQQPGSGQNGAQPGTSGAPASAGQPGKDNGQPAQRDAVRAPDGRQCPSLPGGVLDHPGKDGKPASPAEMADAARTASRLLDSAKEVARRRGRLPAAIAEIVAGAMVARVDWREELQDWFTQRSISDYSWRKPHKGYLVLAGIWAPSADDPALGPVVFAADVSGSVSNRDFGQCAAEIQTVHATARPETLHALQFDTVVQKHVAIGPDDPCKIGTRFGRGGTRAQCVFDWIAEQGIEPVGVVVLTDLAMGPVVDPGYPVLWVSTDPRGKSPDFGKRIDLI